MTGFSLFSGFEKEIIRQLNKYYGQVSNCLYISFKVYTEYYVIPYTGPRYHILNKRKILSYVFIYSGK